MPRVASSPHGAGSRSGSSTILISSRPSTSTFVLAKRFATARLRGGIGFERGRRRLHGAHDLGIGAAATEVAAHRVAHLLLIWIPLARQKGRCRHELSGCAEA